MDLRTEEQSEERDKKKSRGKGLDDSPTWNFESIIENLRLVFEKNINPPQVDVFTDLIGELTRG